MQHPLDRRVTVDQSTVSVVDDNAVFIGKRVGRTGMGVGTGEPRLHIHTQFCCCDGLLVGDDVLGVASRRDEWR